MDVKGTPQISLLSTFLWHLLSILLAGREPEAASDLTIPTGYL